MSKENPSTYDLAARALALEAALADSIDPETGEVQDEGILADLTANRELIADKLDACAAVIRGAKAQADACKAEAKRLSERAASHARTAERVQGLMLLAMRALGESKVKTAYNTVSIRKGSTSVVLDVNPEALPGEFQRITLAADKTALAAALKEGQTIPGARLETGADTITIR